MNEESRFSSHSGQFFMVYRLESKVNGSSSFQKIKAQATQIKAAN